MTPSKTPVQAVPVSPAAAPATFAHPAYDTATHGAPTHSFAVTPDGTLHATRHAPLAAAKPAAPKKK